MAVVVVKPRLGLVAYEVCTVRSHTEEIIPFSYTHTCYKQAAQSINDNFFVYAWHTKVFQSHGQGQQ